MGVKGYRVWCNESKRIIVSRDVVFDENSMLVSSIEKSIDNNVNDDAQVEGQPPNIEDEKNDDDVQQRSPSLSTTRQRRKIVAPRRYIKECEYVAYPLNIASKVEGLHEPSTYKEALASNDSSKWLIAMKQEMESLAKNETWDIVEAQKKRRFLGASGYSRGRRVLLVVFLLYVDDMLLACSSLFEVENLKVLLSSEFDMKDLGEAKKILGMEILRDRAKGVLYLSQRKYIEKVVQRFSMDDAKGVSTPLASHFKLSKRLCPQTKAEEEQMVRIPYTSDGGSVMYAMECSRLDIAHAVSLVSRYMSNLGKGYSEALKWLLRYLKITSNVCLMYGKDPSELTGFCDSDYGGDLDNKNSTSGFVFTLGGSAVSWQSS